MYPSPTAGFVTRSTTRNVETQLAYNLKPFDLVLCRSLEIGNYYKFSIIDWVHHTFCTVTMYISRKLEEIYKVIVQNVWCTQYWELVKVLNISNDRQGVLSDAVASPKTIWRKWWFYIYIQTF